MRFGMSPRSVGPCRFMLERAGKAILAFMDEAEVLSVLEDAKLSANQIRNVTRELKEIRAAGSAFTLGERLPGAGSISAPVFNHEAVAIASVNVLSLEARLNAATVRNFRRLVRATAMAVSREPGMAGNRNSSTAHKRVAAERIMDSP